MRINRLSVKIGVYFWLLLAASLGAAAAVVAHHTREQISQGMRSHQERRSRSLASRMADTISRLANDPERLERELRQFARQLDVRITVRDPQGVVRAASKAGPLPLPEGLVGELEREGVAFHWLPDSGPLMVASPLPPPVPPGWILQNTCHLEPPRGRTVALWSLLAIALVATVLVLPLSHAITRPLRQLQRSALSIAAGQLDERVSTRSGDEIGDLSRSFNTMAAQVQAMVQNQRELIASISHELRSPLARLGVAHEILSDRLRPAEQEVERLMTSIGEDVEAMDRLITELLEMSSLELASGPLACEPADASSMLRLCLERNRPRVEKAGMTIELAPVPDMPPLLVDRDRLGRVLDGIIDNATVHAREGGVVHLEVEGLDGQAAIRVSDRGPGVPMEQLDRIFEPLFRVDSSRSRRTGGTGLGLAIARRTIRAHGGTIRARNLPGGGLVIELEVPLAS